MVVLKDVEGVDAAGIRQHLGEFANRGTISKYAVPETVVFVSTLDRTSVGKPDKKRLRERYSPAA